MPGYLPLADQIAGAASSHGSVIDPVGGREPDIVILPVGNQINPAAILTSRCDMAPGIRPGQDLVADSHDRHFHYGPVPGRPADGLLYGAVNRKSQQVIAGGGRHFPAEAQNPRPRDDHAQNAGFAIAHRARTQRLPGHRVRGIGIDLLVHAPIRVPAAVEIIPAAVDRRAQGQLLGGSQRIHHLPRNRMRASPGQTGIALLQFAQVKPQSMHPGNRRAGIQTLQKIFPIAPRRRSDDQAGQIDATRAAIDRQAQGLADFAFIENRRTEQQPAHGRRHVRQVHDLRRQRNRVNENVQAAGIAVAGGIRHPRRQGDGAVHRQGDRDGHRGLADRELPAGQQRADAGAGHPVKNLHLQAALRQSAGDRLGPAPGHAIGRRNAIVDLNVHPGEVPWRSGINRPGDFVGGGAGVAALVKNSGSRGIEAQPVDAVAPGIGVDLGKLELPWQFAGADGDIIAQRHILAIPGERQAVSGHAGRHDGAVEINVHPVFAVAHAVDGDSLHPCDGDAAVQGRALHPHQLLADLPGGPFPVGDAGSLHRQDVKAVIHGQGAQIADAILINFIGVILGNDREGQISEGLLADQLALPTQNHVGSRERTQAYAVAEKHVYIRQRRRHHIAVDTAETDHFQGDFGLFLQRDDIVLGAVGRKIVNQVQTRLVDGVAAVRQGAVGQPAVAERNLRVIAGDAGAGDADDLIAGELLLRDADIEPGLTALRRDREGIRRRIGRVFRAGIESLPAGNAGVVHLNRRRRRAIGEISGYPESIWRVQRIADIVDEEGGIALQVLPGTMQFMDIDAVDQADVRVAVAGQVRVGGAHAGEVPLQRGGHPPLRQTICTGFDRPQIDLA